MSRGIGAHQRQLLDVLAGDSPAGHLWWTVAELAAATGRQDRQVRAAVRSLHARGAVDVHSAAIAYVPASDGWRNWTGTRLTAADHHHREHMPFPVPRTSTAQVRRRYPRADRPVPGLVIALPARAAAEHAAIRRAADLIWAAGHVVS